jgi:hypothetical protein
MWVLLEMEGTTYNSHESFRNILPRKGSRCNTYASPESRMCWTGGDASVVKNMDA